MKSNVVAQAWRWQRQERWRQFASARGSRFWIGLGLAVPVAGMSVAALLWVARHAIALTSAMLSYPLVLIGVCAMPACYVAMRSRRRLTLEFSNSFLAALPVSLTQIRRAIAASVSTRIAIVLLLATLPAYIAISVAGCDAGTSATLLLCAGFGVTGGGLLGWRLAFNTRRRNASTLPQPGLRWRPRFAARSGMSALGHWPMLQARRGTDPSFHARVLLPVLLTMPTGIPFAVTLAIVSVLVLLIAAFEWLRALREVLPIALHWLRSLPVAMPELIRCVSLRCACWYASATVVAGILSVCAGSAPAPVAVLVMCALTGFVLACAMAFRHSKSS